MVVGVTDGDTIDVAIARAGSVQSVRLAGIDAPESAQAFGTESARHLGDLVSGKAVTLECENEKSYGRLICKILNAQWRGRVSRPGEGRDGVALQTVSG